MSSDCGNVRVVVLCDGAAKAYGLTTYLSWYAAETRPLCVAFDAPQAEACTSAQLVDAAAEAIRESGAGAANALILVGLGIAGVAAMLLHTLSDKRLRVVGAITVAAPLRVASLMSALRRITPTPLAVAAGITLADCGACNTYTSVPCGDRCVGYPRLFSDVLRRDSSGPVCTSCPPPPHPFVNLTFGMLSGEGIWRRLWRSEYCIDDAHAVHLRTPDHAASLYNPLVWRCVLDRVLECVSASQGQARQT